MYHRKIVDPKPSRSHTIDLRPIQGKIVDPKRGRSYTIELSPIPFTPGMVFRHWEHARDSLKAVSDLGLLAVLSEASSWIRSPTPGKSRDDASGPVAFHASSNTTGPVLQAWRQYSQQLSQALESWKKHDKKLRPFFRHLSVEPPKAADVSSFITQRVAQFLETVALDRHEAGLVGPYPISFKGQFIPEIRQTLMDLLPVPAELQERFFEDIFRDLAEAALRGGIRGDWGSLIHENHELVLNILPRTVTSRLLLEPHLVDAWLPVQE
jgi:hypothetical protein